MGKDLIILGIVFLLSLIWMCLSRMFPLGMCGVLDLLFKKFKIKTNNVTFIIGIALSVVVEVVLLIIMLLHIENLKIMEPAIKLIWEMVTGIIGGAEIFVVFNTSSGKLL